LESRVYENDVMPRKENVITSNPDELFTILSIDKEVYNKDKVI